MRFRLALLVAAIFAPLAIPAATQTGHELPMPMATYQFGLLRKGAQWTPKRTPTTDSLQAGHMANIHRMAAEGALIGAGPFLDGKDLRGVFIFGSDSAAAVRPLAERDPAIRAGRLTLDLYSWFAPAGLGMPYKRMSQRPGFRDSLITYQVAVLRTGPQSTATQTPAVAKIQMEHVQGIFRRLASGEMAIAGPLFGGPDTSLAGICVFRGDSATAHRLAHDDPAVKAGRLVVEMHPWMCAYGTMPGDTLR